MRNSRKAVTVFLIAGASLFLLLAISLNILVEKNHDRIRNEIQRALGRPLKFNRLQLSLWGGLGLSATDLRIAEDPRFAATPFIQTQELHMKVSWLPLLLGRVAITEFSLHNPEIQIIKSETGKMNISTFFSAPPDFPDGDGTGKPSPERAERRRSPVSLSISGLRISRGRVHYIDRAVKEPFELLIQNLEMSLEGSALTGKADLRVAASLPENQTQNIVVEGKIGPYGAERDWTRYPLDLSLNAESLLLANLTRALPLLREEIPPYLGINGPISLKARISGSVEHPRVHDLSLTASFFGATTTNTAVTGELDLSRSASWQDGLVKGKIIVEPVDFERLKMIPVLEQALPAGLSASGPLSVTSEISGRVGDVALRTLIKAGESELRYGDWLKKNKGVPAELELNLRRQTERLVFEDSRLTLGKFQLAFSGSLEQSAERPLSLRFRMERAPLSGWDGLLVPLASYQTRGTLDLDVTVKKPLGPPQGEVDLRGALSLADVHAKQKSTGRGVEQFNAKVSFLGKQVRVEHTSLRLGSSTLAFEASVEELARPRIQFTLWSPRLSLADVGAGPAYRNGWMKELKGMGVVENGPGPITIRTRISSSEGIVQEIAYMNLEGDISWTPRGARLNGLSFRALGGAFLADGSWQATGTESQRLILSARIDGMDLKALLTQKLPGFKDQLSGKLDLRARIRAEAKNGASLQENLSGEGETEIRDGMVKDINLPKRVLNKVTDLPGISNLIPSALPARYRSVLERQDTPFEKLAAAFTLAGKRIHARDFTLAAADYTVQGEGWVGLDRTMRWAAELVMSRPFTQELVREHRNARYLLDRQGRLSVPFRVEGVLPQLQAKPDTQWLVEQIERGLAQKGQGRPSAAEPERRRKERQDWLQKGLEKLFGK